MNYYTYIHKKINNELYKSIILHIVIKKIFKKEKKHNARMM